MNLGIEWNAENQLNKVLKNAATIATFAYDPFGRRVEKVAGGTTTTFTYDGADILREIAGAATTYYVHGPGIDEPLAKVPPPVKNWSILAGRSGPGGRLRDGAFGWWKR